MRKTLVVLMAAALLAGACSKKTGGGVKLKTDTDSVAYVIGMNVGMNLMKMDSTINVNAVCEGIRDVFRQGTRFSAADAEVFYLRYMNYALPEKARAYEEQFLQDILKANRNYARTASNGAPCGQRYLNGLTMFPNRNDEYLPPEMKSPLPDLPPHRKYAYWVFPSIASAHTLSARVHEQRFGRVRCH